MTRYARIHDEVVAEIIDTDSDITLQFHPSLQIVEAEADVEVGWSYVDAMFAPPSPPPPMTKDDLIAYAADMRWRKEVGGITFAGVPILTDDRAQLKIAGGRIAAAADPEWTTIWDGADGGSYPINAATMIAISDAVQTHINDACFKLYAAIKTAINAGEITATQEIDAAFAA